MNNLLNQIFDVMTELVLSDGGDGSGWIFVDKHRYEDTLKAFLDWQPNSKTKNWKLDIFGDYAIISDGQEFVGLSYDATKVGNFGDYYIKI